MTTTDPASSTSAPTAPGALTDADAAGGGEPHAQAASLGGALVAVSALLFSVALLLMGSGLQGTLVPVRGNLENFAGLELGLLGTGYFIGFTAGCVLGPALLTRAGHIRAFMAMASVASVTVLIHGIVVEPLIWSALRAGTGFATAVLYIVIESWLNEKSPSRYRGAVLSTYTVLNLTVVTLGQLMIGAADPQSFVLFAVASILVSLAALPLAFTTATSPAVRPVAWPNLRALYRNSPVGVAGCFAVGLANGAFWTLAPVFVQNAGFDAAAVGVFMSIVVIGGALSQWPVGLLSDRIDRRAVLIGVTVAAIGAALLLTLKGDGMWLYAGGLLFGAGAFPVYTLAVAHANDHAQPEDMVAISSGLLLVYGAGAVAGPMVASAVSGAFDAPLLFAYTACVHVVLIGFVLWRLRISPKPAAEDRVSFVGSAVAAQTVAPLGPEDVTGPVADTEATDGRDSS
jgi:MFS family permease